MAIGTLYSDEDHSFMHDLESLFRCFSGFVFIGIGQAFHVA